MKKNKRVKKHTKDGRKEHIFLLIFQIYFFGKTLAPTKKSRVNSLDINEEENSENSCDNVEDLLKKSFAEDDENDESYLEEEENGEEEEDSNEEVSFIA